MNALQRLFPMDPLPLLDAAWKQAEGDLNRAVEVVLRDKADMQTIVVISEDEEDDMDTRAAIDRRHQHMLTVFPDACPSHLLTLCQQWTHESQDQVALAAITDLLLSAPYPTQQQQQQHVENQPKPDAYIAASDARAQHLASNIRYRTNAFHSLLAVFPKIPKPHVRSVLRDHHFQYTPTYLALKKSEEEADGKAYTPLSSGRPGSCDPWNDVGAVAFLLQQAKQDPAHGDAGPLDPEFLREVEALKVYLERDRRLRDEALARSLNRDAYQEMDALLECGCCYDSFPFEDMVQCMEGHLFCRECARRAAEDRLGVRKTDFSCMSAECCTAGFRLKEIQLFLDPAAFQLYHTIVQEQEVQAAVGDRFVSCPFCSFGAVMDDPPEENKLFQCLKCQKTSCRLCQRESHVPMSCEEMDKDKVVALQHKVEEAMTEALLRECPSCKKRFFKEEGCNKMTCTCGTVICYICRAILTDGYKHFERKGATCKLFDDTVTRNANDVLEAAKRAAETLKQQQDVVDAPASWLEDVEKHERALSHDVEAVKKRQADAALAQRQAQQARVQEQQRLIQQQRQVRLQQQQQRQVRLQQQQQQRQQRQQQQQQPVQQPPPKRRRQ